MHMHEIDIHDHYIKENKRKNGQEVARKHGSRALPKKTNPVIKKAKTRSFWNMDGWGANTDILVRVQGEDMRLYAMVLPVILGYLSSQQQRVGNVEEAHLYSKAVCVCFSIALVALTSSCPFPCSSRARQICLFYVILGCALLLSSAVPSMLCWAPYFSCIRPIFHLLPRSFQLRILQFFRSMFDAIKGLVGLVSFVVGSLFQMLRNPFGLLIGQSNAMGQLVSVGVSRNPPQSSSPVQANFNSQQVAVGVAQSSSPARANFNKQQEVEVVELRVQSSDAIGRLVAVGASPHAQSSSPAQANFNSQQEMVELRVQEVTSTDASISGVHKP